MSAAVTTVSNTQITESTQQPPAGSTIQLTGGSASADTPVVFAITDPNTSVSEPVTVSVDAAFVQELASLGQALTVALGTAGATVVLEAVAGTSSTTSLIQITAGVDSSGNALQIGGMIVNASQLGGLTVSLAGGLATATISSERLVNEFPIFARIFNFRTNTLSNALSGSGAADPSATFKAPELNTATQLSRGNDSYLGTEFNDGIILSQGKDLMVGGGGDDLFAAIGTVKNAKSTITLDGSGGNAGANGRDAVLFTKEALAKGKAKFTLTDFSSKADTIVIEGKPNNVKGYNTKTLKISTKDNKTITVTSEGNKFKLNDIDFI